MNITSSPQFALPTYRFERLTGSGKRIDDVVATLTPVQEIWAGPLVSVRLARDCTTAT